MNLVQPDRRILPPDSSKLILATDLDGTLLAGTHASRRRLRDLFSGGLPGAKVIYVTGRSLESIMPLLSDPTIPTPAYIIADVGATIVHGDLRPVEPLQHDIAVRWPGSQAVLRALAGFPLQRQSVPQERRCSFLIREGGITPALRAAVDALGCDLLFSAGRYLDVLPRGVGKGAALLGLAAAEGINLGDIVVAGDTLNDLSMMQAGLRGIVVGGAEPALIEQVRKLGQIHIASAEGCGGILQGLAHHGTLIAPSAAAQVKIDQRGDAALVMVYHRLPFDETIEDGVAVQRPPKSPNGIIPTLLRSFASTRKGAWVAWSEQPSRDPAGFVGRIDVDRERYPNLHAARIALTADDIDLFYKKFSKEAFWPIIFSFPDKAVFKQEHWERFLEVNRLFAEQTAREAADGALVWIHDYNLWMVPAFLRPLRPDLLIAFFHHTAFPSSDIFNILPWRRDIIGSLLQCDYVGFHIPRYVENFVDAARSFAPLEVLGRVACAPRFLTYGCALGVDTVTTAIDAGGRRVGLGTHPVGTDVALVERLVTAPELIAKTGKISDYLNGVTGVISIERLDYVKGSLEKLLAFECLLDEHPEYCGNVTLISIITPAAAGMEIYESLRLEVDRIVGRINGRFSTLEWVPVRYFYRSLSFDEVVAHYAACDIAWITPLRDGLNLVAKEYIAVRKAVGKPGVLVLSEFAGAAVDLHGALLTNPYDARSMVTTLHRALTMGEDERTYRTARLAAIVTEHDVARWAADFEAAASRSAHGIPLLSEAA